jgi:hypothetical protein
MPAMQETGKRWKHPEADHLERDCKEMDRPSLKLLAADASQALARLDVGRLEELALVCASLNRDRVGKVSRETCQDQGPADPEGCGPLAVQARQAAGEMAILARVLEVTRGNLGLMSRLRAMREGRLEYSEAQALGWGGAEGRHGDN